MLMWSMIVELAGGIAVVIAMGAVGATITMAIPPGYLTPGAPPRAVLPALYSALEMSLAITVVIAVASLALQWAGWSRLRNADRLRYGIGRTGVVLLVIGFALAIAADAAIIVLFLPAIVSYLNSFYQAAPALPQPSAISGFVAAAGIALVGAIFAIVGEVMIWIGLWRPDEAYGAGRVRDSIVLEVSPAGGAGVFGLRWHG